MSAVKREFFNLAYPGIPAPSPSPSPSPAPLPPEVYILTFFGEPLSVHADRASAEADLQIMRHGAFLNSRDEQEIDAYAVKAMPVIVGLRPV